MKDSQLAMGNSFGRLGLPGHGFWRGSSLVTKPDSESFFLVFVRTSSTSNIPLEDILCIGDPFPKEKTCTYVLLCHLRIVLDEQHLALDGKTPCKIRCYSSFSRGSLDFLHQHEYSIHM